MDLWGWSNLSLGLCLEGADTLGCSISLLAAVGTWVICPQTQRASKPDTYGGTSTWITGCFVITHQVLGVERGTEKAI